VCMYTTAGTALCVCTGLLVQHCVYVQDCWYSIVCMYRTAGTALCACTGLLVQHCVYVQDCWYSTVCMYRTGGTAFIDCDYNKQQTYSGADQTFTDVYYAIACQLLTVHVDMYMS